MGSSLRFLGCAIGFGFAVVWMTVGLGQAIVCLLLAGLGYGAVLLLQRAEADRSRKTRLEAGPLPRPVDEFELDPRGDVESSGDATTPLAAEAEYGWPWPRGDGEEHAEQDDAVVARGRS